MVCWIKEVNSWKLCTSPALHLNQMVQKMAEIKMLMLVNQMMQFQGRDIPEYQQPGPVLREEQTTDKILVGEERDHREQFH